MNGEKLAIGWKEITLRKVVRRDRGRTAREATRTRTRESWKKKSALKSFVKLKCGKMKSKKIRKMKKERTIRHFASLRVY